MSNENKEGWFRFFLRWTVRGLFALLLLLLLALLFVFRTALYDRIYLFPRQAEAWAQFNAERVEPGLDDGWNEYRGVMHAHSERSHDSAATQEEIVAALHKDNADFILMTDHYADGGIADYSLGWKGIIDGILFVRGYELDYKLDIALPKEPDHGLLPWGLPDGTVFKKSEDPRAVAKRVHELGGVLFFSHTEGASDGMCALPEIDGMEIYNPHTDFMDEKLADLAPGVLLCLMAYPEQTLRLIFDTPTGQLSRWDEMNKTRHITGIAANDAHQNVGIRGYYTKDDTLVLKGTGEKTDIMKEVKLNGFTRAMLRAFFGPLVPGSQVFRFELDPYERSCHYVNTHILAKDLTEKDILDSLRAGRAFVCFNMLADGKGFTCFAQGAANKAVMGESIAIEPGMKLFAAAPNNCRFTVVKDGNPVYGSEGTTLSWEIPGPGKYRVEAALNILGTWTPWIYANPIEIRAAGSQG